MLSLVVLISGAGSNLKALLEACEDAEFPARVVAIGADRDADGFEYAEEYGIPTFSLAMGSFADRDAWADELLDAVSDHVSAHVGPSAGVGSGSSNAGTLPGVNAQCHP